MKKEIVDKIKQAHLRITPALKGVIGRLIKSKEPLSIEGLLASVSANGVHPNKTTLYRQMEKLMRVGLVQETIFSDSIKRYCLIKSDHHHHFYCQSCGKTEDIPASVCQSVCQKIHQQLKPYIIKKHTLELEGLCAGCYLS